MTPTPAELRELTQRLNKEADQQDSILVAYLLRESATALLACAEREENAHDLAGAYWRLEKCGFICTHNADDPEHEAEAEHWKSIADRAMEAIRKIAAAKEKP